MAFIRRIKKKDAVYLAEVRNYRQEGKVKQKVIRYVGKEIEGKVVRTVRTDDIEISSCKKYLDYYVLDKVAGEIGIKEIMSGELRYILLLVYTQIIERKPIYKLPAYIEETYLKELLGIEKIVDKDLYKALDELEGMEFREVEGMINKRLRGRAREKGALVIDVTDTYFRGSECESKVRRGKDGKVSKLIQIALAVTREVGIPIMHKVYEGNIGNVKIFEDMITDVRMKGYETVIIDRGMSSYENIKEIERLSLKGIIGYRMNKRVQEEYLSKIDREEIFQPSNRVKLKNTVVYVKGFEYMRGKLLCVYNPDKEVAKRNLAIERGEFKQDTAKYYGYSLIYHNTEMALEEVVRQYYDKDIVEKAFRELKSSIELHPIRKYRMEHIKAHIKICYIAYALLIYLKKKLKELSISPIEALEQLQSCYMVSLKSSKYDLDWTKTVTLKNQQKAILKALGCSV